VTAELALRAAIDSAPRRIALVGAPNSGKTALFNALTGSRQKVANYPGVTVERKEGRLVSATGVALRLLDLPGTYSLRARSPDEEITRDVVLGRRAADAPDAIVCVADATDLRQGLRLVLELRQVGRPLLLALNMFDLARHRGMQVDTTRLSAELGIPVVTSVAVRRGGTDALVAALDTLVDGAAVAADWSVPGSAELRALHREADRIFTACVTAPPRRDDWTGRLDRFLLHPAAGIVILLVLLFFMFQAVFSLGTPASDAIKDGFDALNGGLRDIMPDTLLRSFLTDGVLTGVGGVIAFLPQILILFLFILLLEDSGYMARAAFLMDKIMGGAGLHGRAFIPLLSSFACAIPGIMAARVIDDRRDRLTTILVAPLMTCSARIPVYTLIIGAFVPDRAVAGGWLGLQGLVMFGLYATGIVSALVMALVFNRLLGRRRSDPFLLVMPDYKLPRLRNVALGLLQRARIFLTRAGTTIFAMMVVIWFLSSFPGAPEGATDPAINYSIAGRIGHALAPVLEPVGFNWQIAIALVPGLAAREVMVAALGTVYAIGAQGDAASQTLSTLLAGAWSLPTALALLAWYVFAPQCASTLGVIRRETGSTGWMLVSFGYMLALAYFAAFVTFRLAGALGA
jgi:ferrous iron transport protein B